MTTRFNAGSKQNKRFGVGPLGTGYSEGTPSLDFTIPSVGIEDVDRALFNLFDKELPLAVETAQGTKRVPIILSSGEKWAMLRKATPVDKSGSLIIPAIVIGRTTISQNSADDITGRGINQNTGTIEIKRRISVDDTNYQALINRLLIPNQDNISVESSDDPEQPTTQREVGDLSTDPTVMDGGFLLNDSTKSLMETIVIPQPQFYTATYDVIVWCQYTQQMNSIIQCLMSSFLPQGNAWRLETTKGYWFVAKVDGGTWNPQNNFDNMSAEERTLKYQFTITVPAYVIAGEQPGQPVPVRRFVSNPDISFSISAVDDEQVLDAGDVIDPFIGSDDPTLPKSFQTSRRDKRDTGDTRLYSTGEHDPARLNQQNTRVEATYRMITTIDGNGNVVKKPVRVKNVNRHTGETIWQSSFDLDGISVVTIK